MKARVFSGWGLTVSREFDRPIDVYVDTDVINQDSIGIKILLLVEPPEILTRTTDYALNNYHKYDYVFTYNDRVLKNCPNARFFIANDTWIKDDYILGNKAFEVSSIVGFKAGTIGHRMRHQLWNSKNRITMPKKFYASSAGAPPNTLKEDMVLGHSKYPLFDSQFHIVIENVQMINMFTEKLIDCFMTKTIPILWGCPNIGDFFDVRGICVVNSVEQIIETCNVLNHTSYDSAKEFVEINHEKGKKYANLDYRLGEAIQSILS